MNRIIRRGSLALLASLLPGCVGTPVQTFYEHERPASPAVLKESDGVYCMVINTFLTDAPKGGMFFPGVMKSYAVIPGDVTVTTTYCRADSTGKVKSLPKTVKFVAEAGHTYRFKSDVPFRMFFAEIKDTDWDVTVVDQDTDAVMVATHDRKK